MTAETSASTPASVEPTADRPTGVLLLNLGTPDSTDTGDVRRYLREFLYDPRVIDIHPVGRFFLLELIILPFRPAKSAEAYRAVWKEEGSPLLVHSRGLEKLVQAELGEGYAVELVMRYGNPSIASGLDALLAKGVEEIVLVPLFPQYSSAANGSAMARTFELAGERWNVPALRTVPAFYDDPGFIQSFVEVAQPRLEAFKPDHVLLSYHGLPERHVKKSDPTGAHCLNSKGCCDAIVPANRYCYRAHCFATSRALAEGLELSEEGYTVCFQSRLGRDPWIKPYTDLQLEGLYERGFRRLAVMCPAFVADCLETDEEIGIRLNEDWLKLGGEALELIPSLNAEPTWAKTVARMIRGA